MSLWTINEVLTAVNGTFRGTLSLDTAINGISIDSRTIATNELYLALKGDVHDGHLFTKNALEKSQSVAIVDKAFATTNDLQNLIIVDDCMEALRGLGIASRARSQAHIIAVTGSVGKTSTKEMLSACFCSYGRTHAAVASFNNHWGVPLTLARMPRDTQFGIFEIGMNHLGEITPLVKMVQPHTAIITTIEPVHLAHFNGIEEIAQAKSEIFDGLLPNGIAILNQDNHWFDYLAEKAGNFKILGFGEGGFEIEMRKVTLFPDCSEIEAVVNGQHFSYTLGAAGKHLAMNSLAVLGALQTAGLDLTLARPALATLKAYKGRGERVMLSNGVMLYDESYNANPASMRAALAVLKTAKTRKIAALGDMLELGSEEIKIHADLAKEHEGVDVFYAQGVRMKAFYEALPANKRGGYAETALKLLPLLQAGLKKGDTLMVKGSLGSRMVDLVAALKQS